MEFLAHKLFGKNKPQLRKSIYKFGMFNVVATTVEGDPKAPFFPITVYSKVGEGATPFIGILNLPLTFFFISWAFNREASSTIIQFFGTTRLGVEPTTLRTGAVA